MFDSFFLCRFLFHLGFPTVMPRVEWTNLSENVQTLKKNISSLEEITVAINTVCKCSEQVRANAERKLKNMYGVTAVSRLGGLSKICSSLWVGGREVGGGRREGWEFLSSL